MFCGGKARENRGAGKSRSLPSFPLVHIIFPRARVCVRVRTFVHTHWLCVCVRHIGNTENEFLAKKPRPGKRPSRYVLCGRINGYILAALHVTSACHIWAKYTWCSSNVYVLRMFSSIFCLEILPCLFRDYIIGLNLKKNIIFSGLVVEYLICVRINGWFYNLDLFLILFLFLLIFSFILNYVINCQNKPT